VGARRLTLKINYMANKNLELTNNRMADAAEILNGFNAFPVLVCGLIPDSKRLICFGFTGQNREEIAVILRDFLTDCEGGESTGSLVGWTLR
jgi:hypothetical protein